MLPISTTATTTTMMRRIHPRWNYYLSRYLLQCPNLLPTTLPYRLYCPRMVVDFAAAVVGFVTLAIVVVALAIVEVAAVVPAAAAAAAHQSTMTLLPLLAPL